MAEDVFTVPVLKLEIPRPKPWDLIALAALAAGVLVAAVNVFLSGIVRSGATVSPSLTVVFVGVQLFVCLGSLVILGKTAKEGTIHGNLFAVGGMFVGLSGVMLAAALWAAA
jgi:drug/metabolite transporter (DMT)-like permease